MKKKRRPPPPKHRAHLAQKARENKPWTRSTGPKTDAGKAAAAQNALKHGLHSETALRLARVLKAHKNHIEKIFGQTPPWP